MDYLAEYNPVWPVWYRQIEGYLRSRILVSSRIEHIGSTSILGMVAKPIIDIDVVVQDSKLADAIASIERAGYAHQGDLGIPGREAFKPILEITQSLPPHHLYACVESSSELRKHISFREYLKVHSSESERLALLKRQLAFEQMLSQSEYILAKAFLVTEITTAALKWYGKHDSVTLR